jgi:hypothetical protein
LTFVHGLITLGKVRATDSALRGAAHLDLDYDEMVSVVKALTMADFY